MVGVANVRERVRFLVPVADLAVQAEGLRIADDGAGVVAEPAVDIAEAVVGRRFAV
jgi:hypothetical protein